MVTGLAVDQNLTVVGLIEAIEDRHQRRLAAPFPPMMPWIVPLRTLRIDVPVGVDQTEALVYSTQFDGNIFILACDPLFARFGSCRNRADNFFTIWYKFITISGAKAWATKSLILS